MDLTCPVCGTSLQATATDRLTVIVCSACSRVIRIPHDGGAFALTITAVEPTPNAPAAGLETTADPGDEETYSRADERRHSPAAEASFAPGTRFGDYEIVAEIARGGMGVVFKARQIGLNRVVALKMILTGQLASEDQVRRFYVEAESAAHLDHPGIVPIYEVGQHDGRHFYSMGYVEGTSLARRLATGPLPPRDAAELIKQTALAVAYAHQRGVIHRDLKPANILLDAQGQPRVTDFGLAKRVEGDSQLTATGGVIGTPSYMPPEQAAGRADEAGPLVDVYSLGATLYCLLTGRPPFQAASAVETLKQVIEYEPVSPRQLNDAVDRDLETICLKCLEKEPARRYQSADALADDLGRFLDGRPIVARPVSRGERMVRWCRRNPAIAGLLALVVIVTLTGLGLVLWKSEAAIRAAKAEAGARQVAEEKTRQALRDNALMLLEKSLVVGAAGDGDKALFHLVEAIDRAGGAEDVALDDSLRRQFSAWTRTIHSLQGHLPIDGVHTFDVSPDGKRLLTAERANYLDPKRNAPEAVLWDIPARRVLWRMRHEDTINMVGFSPSGRYFLTSAGNVAARNTNLYLWQSSRREQPVRLPHVATQAPARVVAAIFTPDEQHVLSGSPDGALRLWKVPSGELDSQIAAHSESVALMTLSPDGKRLATAARRSVPETYQIKLWSFPDLKPLGQPIAGEGPLYAAVFDGVGRLHVSSGQNMTLECYLGSDGSTVGYSVNPDRRTSSLVRNRDGFRLLAGGDGFRAIHLQRDGGQRVRPYSSFVGTTGHVSALGFHPDESSYFAAAASPLNRFGELVLRQCRSNARIGSPLRQSDRIQQARFAEDGRLLFTLSDKRLAEWRLAGAPKFGPPPSSSGKRAIAMSPSGRHALFQNGRDFQVWDTATERPQSEVTTLDVDPSWVPRALGDSVAAIWSGPRDVLLWRFASPQAPVLKITHSAGNEEDQPDSLDAHQLSPDERLLATACGSRVRLWDTTTGQELGPSLEHTGSVDKLRFSPCSRYLVTDKRARDSKPDPQPWRECAQVWDLQSRQPLAPALPLEENTTITALGFTSDSRRLMVGLYTGQTQIWDLASAQPIGPTLRHAGRVSSLALSGDERLLLTASTDHSARLWDVATGQGVGPALPHDHFVLQGLLTDDGRIAITLCPSGVRLWDVRLSRMLGPVIQVNEVTELALSEDQRHVLVAEGGTHVLKVPLPEPVEGSPEQLRHLVERLTGVELDGHGEVRILSVDAWNERKE